MKRRIITRPSPPTEKGFPVRRDAAKSAVDRPAGPASETVSAASGGVFNTKCG